MNRQGIQILCSLSAWFEDKLGGETLSLGRAAEEPVDCSMELVGRNLTYQVLLNGDTISLFCCGADQLIVPRLLLRVGIDRQNLRVLATLIKKLESSGLRDLDEQIIELGDAETDPHGTIIIGD
jgi:hypothetical protein